VFTSRPKGVGEAQLHQHFAQFGRVLHVLPLNTKCAIIAFCNPAAAQASLAAPAHFINGHELQVKQAYIKKAKSSPPEPARLPPPAKAATPPATQGAAGEYERRVALFLVKNGPTRLQLVGARNERPESLKAKAFSVATLLSQAPHLFAIGRDPSGKAVGPDSVVSLVAGAPAEARSTASPKTVPVPRPAAPAAGTPAAGGLCSGVEYLLSVDEDGYTMFTAFQKGHTVGPRYVQTMRMLPDGRLLACFNVEL